MDRWFSKSSKIFRVQFLTVIMVKPKVPDMLGKCYTLAKVTALLFIILKPGFNGLSSLADLILHLVAVLFLWLIYSCFSAEIFVHSECKYNCFINYYYYHQYFNCIVINISHHISSDILALK